MSAWLRSSPATRMPSTRTTNVETTTRAITPPPLPGLGPVSTRRLGGRRRGTPPGAAAHDVGHTPDVPAHDDLFLPEPEPREVRYTVISVDDHVVEPARHVRGAAPRRAAGPGAPDRRDARRAIRCGSSRAQRYTQVGMNAVAGRRPETVRPGAVPLRPDAAGLLRRRRPRARHGHQRRVGLGELPVHDHRLLRAGVLRRRGPRSRPGLCPRLERLALRGVVHTAPRADRAARDHLSRRPGAGRGGDPAQRRRAASPR